MTLKQYFEKVYNQIAAGKFKILNLNSKPDTTKFSVHIEALNYFLYEFNEDNKDPRNIFDYVLKPDDCDWDFTSITFDDFFDFITEQKDKDALIININDKSTYKTQKLTSKPKLKPTSKPKSILKDYTNHSGGAEGSDIQWDKIGKEYGMINNKHYYFEGYKTPYGNTPISIDLKNEADDKLKAANKTLKRKFPTSKEYINNLLRRNWWQVKNSEGIFAISTITNNKVDGGTGWAVHMGILENKNVYVFDQNINKWFTWKNKKFIEISNIPILTKNFAGIGTREINEKGIQAIKYVYENIINPKEIKFKTKKEKDKSKENKKKSSNESILDISMYFEYNGNQRKEIKSKTTFDAVLNEERFSTLRKKSLYLKNPTYWEKLNNLKKRDIITIWSDKNLKDNSVKVKITDIKLYKKGQKITEEELEDLSINEGWKKSYLKQKGYFEFFNDTINLRYELLNKPKKLKKFDYKPQNPFIDDESDWDF